MELIYTIYTISWTVCVDHFNTFCMKGHCTVALQNVLVLTLLTCILKNAFSIILNFSLSNKVQFFIFWQHWNLNKQELLTLPEHLRSPPVFSGVCVAQSLGFCVVKDYISLFVLFLLAINQFSTSGYPFGIFNFPWQITDLMIHIKICLLLNWSQDMFFMQNKKITYRSEMATSFFTVINLGVILLPD